MTSEKILTISEPPLEKILRIGHKGFGYLNPEVDKLYLETIDLGPCIGIYGEDSKNRLQILAHIHSGILGYGNQVNQFLVYLKNKRLTNEKFDRILLLRSQIVDEKGIDEVYSTLKIRGHKNLEIVDGDLFINAIFDRKGDMYWVDPKTIKDEEKIDDDKLDRYFRIFPDALRCENTGEIVQDQYDPLYPGIERICHKLDAYGYYYCVRIPFRKKFDKAILDELNQEARQKGVEVSVEKCKYGKYIEISKYGYPVCEDKHAVMEVNNLAVKLIKSISIE